jgi:hypothetical protein
VQNLSKPAAKERVELREGVSSVVVNRVLQGPLMRAVSGALASSAGLPQPRGLTHVELRIQLWLLPLMSLVAPCDANQENLLSAK